MNGANQAVHLRVGCLDYGRGQAVQRAALSGLRAEHPATRVTLVPETFDLQVAHVLAGSLDVGFCAGAPPPLAGLVAERLFEDRVDCALLPADHPFASMTEVSVTELSGTELQSIDPDASPEIMDVLQRNLRGNGWRGRATLDCRLPAEVMTKIACGAGWTPAPRSILGWDPPGTAVRPLAEGALVAIDCHVLRRSDASRPAIDLVRTLHRAHAALERRRRERELSSFARVKVAVRGERRRIARELHDGVLQDVIAASLTLEAALRRWPGDADGARAMVSATTERLERTASAAREAVTSLRNGPSSRGLWLALSAAAAELRAMVPADLRLRRDGAERPLPPDVEEACYRIGVEALTNAFTHAGASRIDLTLEYGAEALCLRIVDDGRGLPEAPGGPAAAPHFGLVIMRERAEDIGATLGVSSADGRGTRVELRVPWRAPLRTLLH